MRTHVRWRHVVAVAALVFVAAPGAIAQPTVQSTGPTRIKIAVGMVSAEDTRAGLLGAWEPDADLGLPAGSNHTIYLADGLYINPFRNAALIAFWSATADVLTSTPFDMRQLATGAPAPELKEVFQQIGWDKPTVRQITWLTPDRFQEKSRPEAWRRAQPVHAVTTVHRATVVDLLLGSWIRPGGATVVFEPDGTFREQVSSGLSTAIGPDANAQTAARGTYDFDAVAGLLWRTNTAVDTASLAARILQTSSRAASRLRWTSRDIVTIDSEQWTRQSKAAVAPAPPSTGQTPPAGQPPCPTCATAGRGWLGVALAGVVVARVDAGSPAERAGLRVGDRIVAINGTNIQDGGDMVKTIRAIAPGTEAILTVVRDGARIEQRVTLGTLPQ